MKSASKKRKTSKSALDETTLLQQNIDAVKKEDSFTNPKKSPTTTKTDNHQPVEQDLLIQEIIKASILDLQDLYTQQLNEKPFLMLGGSLLSGYVIGRLLSPRKKLTRFLLKRMAKMMGKQALRYALSYLVQSMFHRGNDQTSPNKGSI